MAPRETRAELLGRGNELARIETAFAAEADLITIVGPPGAGKTRLATAVSARRAPRRVVWCELQDVTGVGGFCEVLARELGIGSLSGSVDEVIRALGDELRALPEALVVLDNFEQVVHLAATTVGAWSPMSGVQLLVTSRERLDLPNERLVQIGGLSTEFETPGTSPAAELFRRRAATFVDADAFDLDALEAVEQIVRSLGGLPLAIELAATRLRVLGVEELRAYLAEGQPLFDMRSTATRSLRSVIASSWDRAPPPVQEALMRLSVFRGGISREAAAAVLELDASATLERIQDLVERSLLQLTVRGDGTSRYTVYVVVRQFAEERLEAAGRYGDVRELHARAFTDLAEARLQVTGAVSAELDNLVAAHRFCLSPEGRARGLPALVLRLAPMLARGLWVSAPVEVCMTFLDEALAEVDSEDVATRATILALQATALCFGGHGPEAEGLCARILELVDRHALPRSSFIRIHNVRGLNAWLGGRFAEAADHYRTFLKEAGSLEPGQSLYVSCNLAGALIRQGRYTEAFDALRDAESAATTDARRDFLLAGRWAELARAEGSVDEAHGYLERALAEARSLSSGGDEAMALVELAELARERGELERAETLLAEAKPRVERTPFSSSPWHLAMARLCESRQSWEGARAFYEKAIAALRRYRHVRDEAVATMHLAVTQAAGGEPKVAARSLQHARRLLERVGASSDQTGDLARAQLVDLVDHHIALATAHAKGKRLPPPVIPPASQLLASDIADPRHVASIMLRLWAAVEPSEAPVGVLSVDLTTRTVTLPSGESIPLGARAAHWRIFVAMARRHVESPGVALSPDEILAIGWPEDVVRPPSRVYVAISALRRAGLRDQIDRHADGYLLSPSAPVVFHE